MQIPNHLLQNTGAQWNNTIILTLLHGGHLNPNLVMRSVKTKWSVRESSDILRAGANRFICRFHKPEDHTRIWEKQPLQVLGHIIVFEAFSTGMNANTIGFKTVPLWMSFTGLELEHHSTEIVEMIASVVGPVNEVLPVEMIPRTAEEYRVNVNVKVIQPLIQGTKVNTLIKGEIWVGFKYNGLPSLYCIICFRLGHDRANCQFLAIKEEIPLLMIAYHGETEEAAGNNQASSFQPAADVTTPTWPHEVNPLSSPFLFMSNPSIEPNIEYEMPQAQYPSESPDSSLKKIVQVWSEAGLLSNDEIEDLGLDPPTITKPIPNFTPHYPNPTEINPDPTTTPNLISLSSTYTTADSQFSPIETENPPETV
ncbi:hypothetical protein FRX31_032201 [Thalictrum thalictroides]|uniref:Zinc knuckle CX2CX4HX4C domain-containing protein n=1 Tax=Thalictrum thalictroides TaxID=46969 RepID=A0A7J6V0E7_THATH|nr:hypothetical protein FRX31_032201 [Thalictrum thalictroides]